MIGGVDIFELRHIHAQNTRFGILAVIWRTVDISQPGDTFIVNELQLEAGGSRVGVGEGVAVAFLNQ